MLQQILTFLSTTGLGFLMNLIGAALIIVIGFWLSGFVVKAFDKAKGAERLSGVAKSLIKNTISIGLKVLVILSAAIIVGIPAATIVTLLGSVGLAIGLALQGGLSNIAGGVLIMIFKPFEVGDFISDGTNSGTVTDVNIFYTTLMTPDKKRVVIPNGSLSNAAITDFSASDIRRVDLTYTVSYDSDIDLVKKVLLAAAANNPLVLNDPETVVALIEHGESALVFALRPWCKNADYWTVTFALNEDVKSAFDQFGISIPYPQLDVHVKGNNNQEG